MSEPCENPRAVVYGAAMGNEDCGDCRPCLREHLAAVEKERDGLKSDLAKRLLKVTITRDGLTNYAYVSCEKCDALAARCADLGGKARRFHGISETSTDTQEYWDAYHALGAVLATPSPARVRYVQAAVALAEAHGAGWTKSYDAARAFREARAALDKAAAAREDSQ